MSLYRVLPEGNGYVALITSAEDGKRSIERVGEYKTAAAARKALEVRAGRVEWTENAGMWQYQDNPGEIMPYRADLSAVGKRKYNGARVMDFVVAILDHYARWESRFEILITAAWIVHTWFDLPGRGDNGGNGVLAFNATPRLMLIGEKETGKSRKEMLIRAMVRNPTGRISGIVTAYGVRNALVKHQTVILDEVQRIFGARNTRREDLQGILAGGYVHDGVSMNGKAGEGEQSIFGPVCLAAQPGIMSQIADNPLEDLISRSFLVFCEKSRDEIPDLDESFDVRTEIVRRELAAWAAGCRTGEKLWNVHTIPDVLTARDREITMPLLAVADRATPPDDDQDLRWAVLIREAAVRMLTGGRGAEGDVDREMEEMIS